MSVNESLNDKIKLLENQVKTSLVHLSGLYYKCFTIVIYDRNDSGQYYKTKITIVIDNPS